MILDMIYTLTGGILMGFGLAFVLLSIFVIRPLENKVKRHT